MTPSGPNPAARGFTPAAGVRWLTPLYDAGVAVATRERRWRRLLVEQVRAGSGDVIVDVGCGTGSLLVLLGRAAPGASLVGIDPDPEVLRRAAGKAAAAGLAIEFLRGFAEDTAALLAGRRATKAVSSLVFHQVPLAGKEAVHRLNDLLQNSMSNTEDLLGAMYNPQWDAESLQNWYEQSAKSPADLALFKIMFSLRYTIDEPSPRS